MSNITDRMKTLVNFKTTELKKYKEMEELTHITAASWRSWWNRGGPPSGEMIEAVCAIWPDYAFWLVTGITDFDHGHNSPLLTKEKRPRTAALDLFAARIEAMRWSETNSATEEDTTRWLKARDNNGAYDAELDGRMRKWHSLVLKIDQLEAIRAAQEESLEKYEGEQMNKQEMPF